jgi:hypothetical protein
METKSTLFDVLSGNESVKAEVGISTETIIGLSLAVITIIIFTTLFFKKFS